jgi:Flp pilus assembly protein TadD
MPDPMEASASRLERLQSYLLADPTNIPLRRDAMHAALSARKFETVIELGRGEEADAEALFMVGTACLALGRNGEAVDLFAAVLKEDPANHAARYNMGYALVALSRFEEAHRIFVECKDGFHSEVPGAARLAALASYHSGDMETGIRTLRAHLDRSPDDADALGLVALMQFDDGNAEDARVYSSRAVQINPTQQFALLARGGLALEEMNAELAGQCFEAVLATADGLGRAWSGKAFAQLLKLDFEGAEASFEKAVILMPDHIGTWHGLAWIQMVKGKFDEAEASLMKAMALDRNFGETHGSLAVLSALRGQASDSERLARRAGRLNPEGYSGRYAKALLQARTGDAVEANKMISALLDSSPQGAGASVRDLVSSIVKGQRQKSH